MTASELNEKIAAMQRLADNDKISDSQRKLAKEKLAQFKAELKDLEPKSTPVPAKSSKAPRSKAKKQPKAKKEPKAKTPKAPKQPKAKKEPKAKTPKAPKAPKKPKVVGVPKWHKAISSFVNMANKPTQPYIVARLVDNIENWFDERKGQSTPHIGEIRKIHILLDGLHKKQSGKEKITPKVHADIIKKLKAILRTVTIDRKARPTRKRIALSGVTRKRKTRKASPKKRTTKRRTKK